MRAVPQFGERRAGRTYADRPAAFGILERDERIAVVRIAKPDGATWIDLPGGGVDPGETPEEGVVRVFCSRGAMSMRPKRSLSFQQGWRAWETSRSAPPTRT